MESTDALGGFLRAKRLELHLTQEEVGERAKIPTSYVCLIETGRLRPKPMELDRLSTVLGNCRIPPELISLRSDRNTAR